MYLQYFAALETPCMVAYLWDWGVGPLPAWLPYLTSMSPIYHTQYLTVPGDLMLVYCFLVYIMAGLEHLLCIDPSVRLFWVVGDFFQVANIYHITYFLLKTLWKFILNILSPPYKPQLNSFNYPNPSSSDIIFSANRQTALIAHPPPLLILLSSSHPLSNALSSIFIGHQSTKIQFSITYAFLCTPGTWITLLIAFNWIAAIISSILHYHHHEHQLLCTRRCRNHNQSRPEGIRHLAVPCSPRRYVDRWLASTWPQALIRQPLYPQPGPSQKGQAKLIRLLPA